MTTLDVFEDYLDGVNDEVLRDIVRSLSEVDGSNDIKKNEKYNPENMQDEKDRID